MSGGTGKKCTVCGEWTVIQEEHGAVCMECGTFTSDSMLVNEATTGYQDSNFHVMQLPEHSKHFKAKEISFTVQKCLMEMKHLCSKLKYSATMVESVKQLFNRAYPRGEFKFRLSYSKHMLAYGCVYIVGRQFNFPITIKEFCVLTRQSVSDMAKMYQKLVTDLQIYIQYQSIASIITYHLSDKMFTKDCLDMIQDIIRLYSRASSASLPHRDTTIAIAAFLAWGSQNLAEYRKCTLKTFAKKHKFVYTHTWLSRLKELQEILTKIGSRLPWLNVSDACKKDFVVHNLKDILAYQNSLLLKETRIEEESEESDEDEEDNVELHEGNVLAKGKTQTPTVDVENETTSPLQNVQAIGKAEILSEAIDVETENNSSNCESLKRKSPLQTVQSPAKKQKQ